MQESGYVSGLVGAGGVVKRHDAADFAAMRRAGRLAAACLDDVTAFIKPGVTTDAIDRRCHAFITSRGGEAAPLHYRGYPRSVCTSVNHVVCHGIPGVRVLREGDIVNVDVTVRYRGWHGDSSRMFFAGKVGVKARRLVRVAYEALMRGIAVVRPGATLGDVGHAVQSHAEAHGLSVVRAFCGHGLGRAFHDLPQVMHVGAPGEGLRLEEGMFFTIEPMLNVGGAEVKLLADGWTAVTRDRSLSAQFEHSIGVTGNAAEIFTLSPLGLTAPPYG